MDSVSVQTIQEQIAEHMRYDILSGKLATGEALREQSLAKRFGVSRGPIRDVLLKLTQEGLLVSKPNCGVRVGAAPDELIQPLVVSLRQQIEVFALETIFEKLDDNAIKKLEKIVDNQLMACKQGVISKIVKLDMAFHRQIIEMTGDDNLVAIWLPIVLRMMLHYTRHKGMMENYREHASILEAIRARNLEQAVAALKQNIQ